MIKKYVNKIVIDSRVQRSFDLKHEVNTIISKFDQAFKSLPILPVISFASLSIET